MPIPIVTSPAPFPGTSGTALGAPATIVLPGTSGAEVALPGGWQEIVANASITIVQYTNGTTAVTTVSAGQGGAIWSDGTNTKAHNIAASAQTLTYLPILGL